MWFTRGTQEVKTGEYMLVGEVCLGGSSGGERSLTRGSHLVLSLMTRS